MLALLFTSVTARLFFLVSENSIYTSVTPSKRTAELVNYRGLIYDRYGRKLVYNNSSYRILIKPSHSVLTQIKALPESEKITENIKRGKLSVISVNEKPSITENENITVTEIKERYSSDFLCHILGYTDTENNGICGTEKICNNILKTNKSKISVIYDTDALGRALLGTDTEIRFENENDKSGVMLTVDKDIQEIAESEMKKSTVKKGAVIILDCKTAEILASVSVPTFDLNNPGDCLKDESSPFINRAFSQFAVGSVFKVVTAAAYTENHTEDFKYYCKGSTVKSDTLFNCSNTDGHKSLYLTDALSKSCNTYFIELANTVGGECLYNTAKKLGFDESYDIGMGYTVPGGYIPVIDSLNSEAAIGNFGFGQGELTASPLQIAVCFNTLANNGIFKYPKLIKSTVNSDGSKENIIYKSDKRVLKEATAEKINNALLNAVLNGTGTNAYSKSFSVCGKTATAETGRADENGNPVYNTWFCGFFPYENPQYVICILKENGTSGSSDDAPVFKNIAERIYALNR